MAFPILADFGGGLGAGGYFLGRLDAADGQCGIGEQADLFEHRALVPIDVFVRELAIAEATAWDVPWARRCTSPNASAAATLGN